MGAADYAVDIITGAAPVMAAAATTVGMWLGTRSRRTRIRVRNGDKEIEIDGGHVRDPIAIAEQILRNIGDDA
jgi:hypothetical protein